jgi:hypothetical protein
MNEITIKWNHIYTKGITLSTSTKINTLPFADDQVILADSGDDLERGVLTLPSIANNFGMEISPEKSETMAFLGQDAVKCTHHNIHFKLIRYRIHGDRHSAR